MANSTNLLLPYLEAAQAQKHVTVNESLRLLDALVRTRVEVQGLTAPPGSPVDGTVYIPASGATGAWAGWDFNLAYYVDGAWQKIVPKVGWIVYDADQAGFFIHVGAPSYWAPLPGGPTTKPLLIVAAGQSNMLGATSATDGDKTGSASVFAWDTSAAEFNVAALGANPFSTAGGAPNNLAFHFCQRLAAETGRAVYLVFYAVSATSVAQWNSTYFSTLDGYVDAALASDELTAAGVTKADAMLWHQGEADYTTDGENYRAGLETLIASARAADWGSARMAFIAGELVAGAQLAQNGTLRQMASDGSDPNFALAAGARLSDVGDALHYDGASLATLGAERYYAAYAALPKSYPATSAREVLQADRTYYVDASGGDDANDGLTSGNALATIAKALDVVMSSVDLGGYEVTIQLADGAYTENVVLESPQVGAGTIKVRGNSGTPGSVTWSASSGHTLYTSGFGTKLQLEYLDIGAASRAIWTDNGSHVIVGAGVRFQSAAIHMVAGNESMIQVTANYSIEASASYHYYSSNATIIPALRTLTIPSALAFSIFAYVTRLGFINAASMTFAGAGVAGTTGARYQIQANGVIDTSGGGASYLPGSTAGSALTGGQYL